MTTDQSICEWIFDAVTSYSHNLIHFIEHEYVIKVIPVGWIGPKIRVRGKRAGEGQWMRALHVYASEHSIRPLHNLFPVHGDSFAFECEQMSSLIQTAIDFIFLSSLAANTNLDLIFIYLKETIYFFTSVFPLNTLECKNRTSISVAPFRPFYKYSDP